MSAAGRIAFVCPRFAEGSTVGGAETLLRNLAQRAASAGREVDFLTTCATSHFTWANEAPPGRKKVGNITVQYFPVDEDRDIGSFLKVQEKISRRLPVTPEEEMLWLRNNVNSRALYVHLQANDSTYDRIVAGPYLFGLVYFASLAAKERSVLVPCLHDEGFAYLDCFRKMFLSARTIMFNSAPERDLATRLYKHDFSGMPVVGMGMDSFDADPAAFSRKHGITEPYVIYSGRREPLKGTPMLLDYMSAFRSRTGKDIKLVLTGSGPVEPPPDMLPHIVDLGFVPEETKREAMAGAVAFCHPSVNESFGIVLLESWLARTPGLVNAAGEVLKHQCRMSNGGLWFRNYPDFEEELMMLISNPRLRKTMGAAGRAYVLKEYEWPRVEERLLAALDR